MKFNFNEPRNIYYRLLSNVIAIVVTVGCLIMFLALVKLAWWYLTLR